MSLNFMLSCLFFAALGAAIGYGTADPGMEIKHAAVGFGVGGLVLPGLFVFLSVC